MIRNLVLSGGAMKGFSFIGALAYLEEIKVLKDIKNVIGTSAGSIVALLLCLNMDVSEIEVTLNEFMQEYTKKEVDIDNLINIYEELGIDSGVFVKAFLGKVLHSVNNVYDMTFRELAKKSGRNLVIVSSNISQRRTDYFSVDSTPDISVITAIRASIAIPIIMCPVKINNDYYIDGGIFNNFPIEYFDSSSKPFRDTIGLCIESVSKSDNNAPINLVSYIGTIIDAMCERLNYKVPKESNNHIVRIKFTDTNPYDYDMNTFSFIITEDTLKFYKNMGYEATKHQLSL